MGQIQDNADGTTYFVGDNFDDFSHGLASFLEAGCTAELKTEQSFTALLRCPDETAALPPVVKETGLVEDKPQPAEHKPAAAAVAAPVKKRRKGTLTKPADKE